MGGAASEPVFITGDAEWARDFAALQSKRLREYFAYSKVFNGAGRERPAQAAFNGCEYRLSQPLPHLEQPGSPRGRSGEQPVRLGQ